MHKPDGPDVTGSGGVRVVPPKLNEIHGQIPQISGGGEPALMSLSQSRWARMNATLRFFFSRRRVTPIAITEGVPQLAPAQALHEKVLEMTLAERLSSLDDRLIEVLQREDIRLVA